MSANTIENFHNLHREKRLFIMASGTSLKDHDLSKLKNRMTMGLNRSFIAYPDTYYHCVFDHRLFDLYPEELGKTRLLFTLEDRPLGIPIHLLGSKGFSWDLSEGIFSGYTISYFALQVAVYMGFTEIYFLGLDLKNKDGFTHFFGLDARSKNHETTEYIKMRDSFNEIALTLKERNIQVFNCSPISTLNCFPFKSFDEAVSL
jgi:hypothetical protein